MKKLIIGAILLVGYVGHAIADCEYQGKWYPTGTRIGPMVCQADGTWKRQ
jgi:hypothetical protein